MKVDQVTAQKIMDELCEREALRALVSHYSYEAIGDRHGVSRSLPYHLQHGSVRYATFLNRRRLRIIFEEVECNDPALLLPP